MRRTLQASSAVAALHGTVQTKPETQRSFLRSRRSVAA